MKKAIYISIKPEYTKKIVSGEKTYEFRSFYPKREIDTLFVYETVPTKELKYIIEIGEVIKYPDKLIKGGCGNKEFNEGLSKRNYAYEIKHLYILDEPIKLIDLKNKYNFIPPQGYAYDDKYKELTEKLKNTKLTRII